MPLPNDQLERLFHAGITVLRREIVLPTVAGRYAYTIPVGNWFNDRPRDTSLDIDTGSGWIPQAYGADYSHLGRYTAPATVADTCIGWELAGPPPAGWRMRFRWNEWVYKTSSSVLIPVRLAAPGDSEPDYSVKWFQAIPGSEPNAIQVPAVPGFCAEFWRKTSRTGGLRGIELRRSGKRYVPYWRGTADQFVVHRSVFSSCTTTRRQFYRVCYYDPITGARSPLSSQIAVASGFREDRLRTFGTAHVGDAVWVR